MIFLRGLWWRRGVAVAVLFVGALGAAVAALGPLYSRAATESALTQELRSAGFHVGLAFSRDTNSTDPAFRARFLAQTRGATRVRGFGRPIYAESLVVTVFAPGATASADSTMVYRSGVCAHVHVVSGRCPSRPGETMVPAADASGSGGWRLGRSLQLHQPIKPGDIQEQDGVPVGTVRVVATYRPRDIADPYWFGQPYFASALGSEVTSALKTGADAIFVTAGQFSKVPPLPPSPGTNPYKHLSVDVPIMPSRIRLDDLPRLRREVSAVQRRYPREPPSGATPGMRTGLTTVLGKVNLDRRSVEAATLVVVLELAALSALVLFQVVDRAVAGKGHEIALAKLRGLRPPATVRFALAEPLALLLVAIPLGYGIADLAAHLLSSYALLPGTPVATTWATGVALLAAGSALAAAAAAARTLTRPVLEQWRDTAPPRRWPRTAVAVESTIAVAAVAIVGALRADNSGRPRTEYFVAPALIVFAVALIGTRVLPRVLEPSVRRTRASRRVALFLALRQTVRRAGGMRLAVVLSVAAGLAIFAMCAEAVARGNRAARAETEIGAPRTLAVLNAPGHDPQVVVDSVDPGGRWASTVASWSTDAGPADGRTVVGRMLGVEPRRLAATGYRVRGQQSPASLATALVDPSTPPPAEFHGRSLTVTIDAGTVTGDRPVVRLGYRYRYRTGGTVAAGTLLTGRHSYSAPVPCTTGCVFTGVTVDRSVGAADQVRGTLTLAGVRSGRSAVPVRLTAAAWRSQQIGLFARTSFHTTRDGVQAAFASSGGSAPVLAYADTPRDVPLVVTPRVLTSQSDTGGVGDFSGTIMTFRVVRRASPLPVLLANGSIADLDYLRQRLPNFDREAGWNVWLGPHAPDDAVHRLTAAGLLVESQRSAADRVAQLSRQGPALGLLLLLVCAAAAAVLAIGGLAVAVLSESRRRSYEFAALRIVGVRLRVIRRCAILEQVLLLGIATATGLVSGYVAAAVTLPVVPEFGDTTPVVLRFGPPIVLSLVTAATFTLLLLVTAVTAGTALARSALPARLRETAG